MSITRSIISDYQQQQRRVLHACSDVVAIIRPAWKAQAHTYTHVSLVSLDRQPQWLASSLGMTWKEAKSASGVISFSVI
jgi:hypothetical protein